MTPTRFAFIKANWHSDIVDQALVGFSEVVAVGDTDVYDAPGAFELPLLALKLARTGKYKAVVAAALVVDGGIYRHEFVAQAVVSGLMDAGLKSGVPVLSVSLTPQAFQETEHHAEIFRSHFIQKGREAGQAALQVARTHLGLAEKQGGVAAG